MPLTIDLPTDIEQELRRRVSDLDRQATESLAIQFFRQGILNHFQLSRVLELDRLETDASLKHHGVTEGTLSAEDLESDYEAINQALGKAH